MMTVDFDAGMIVGVLCSLIVLVGCACLRRALLDKKEFEEERKTELEPIAFSDYCDKECEQEPHDDASCNHDIEACYEIWKAAVAWEQGRRRGSHEGKGPQESH